MDHGPKLVTKVWDALKMKKTKEEWFWNNLMYFRKKHLDYLESLIVYTEVDGRMVNVLDLD